MATKIPSSSVFIKKRKLELELADKWEDTGTTISLKLFQLVFLSNLTKK